MTRNTPIRPTDDVTPAPGLTAGIDTGAWPDPAFDPAPLAVRLRFTAPPRPQDPREGDGEGGSREPAPLAISLVIDRSGSMSGHPIEAAKAAAIQLQDQLGDRDFRGVISFDTRIEEPVPFGPANRSTDAGRRAADEAIAAIGEIQARGGTNLTDGWRRGTSTLEHAELPADTDAMAVVLSDGMGNHGETRPHAMRELAAAAASWGVRTTCIGVGHRYSTPQLEALSEGGEGSLHQATTPEQIVECVLGELGRVRSIAARDVAITLTVPHGLWITVVGGRSHEISTLDSSCGLARATRTVRIRLGDVADGATVEVGLLLNRFGAPKRESVLHFPPIVVNATWTCAVTGEPASAEIDGGIALPSGVRAVAGDMDPSRNRDVAASVAQIWHATIIRDAGLMNEARRYEEAGDRVARTREAFRAFARGLPEIDDLVRTLDVAERRSRGRWEGRSKKEMMVLSRKMARSERDPRAAMRAAMYREQIERED